jgi:proteasome lid subunit RPN8/RPN11
MEDKVQVELGRTVHRTVNRKKSPAEDKAYAVTACGQPADYLYPVFIREKVIQLIRNHVFAEPEREVGGILVGEFCKSRRGYFIQINDAIVAQFAESTNVSLTFTHETWKQVHAELANKFPSQQILGWYHSHPGLGIFMSKEDEFIHQNYFPDPCHIALIVDPTLETWGVFEWSNNSPTLVPGFYVFTERTNADALDRCLSKLSIPKEAGLHAATASGSINSPMPFRRRWTSVGIVIPLVVLLFLMQIGLWVSNLRSRQSLNLPSYAAVAADMLAIGDLTGGERLLRLQLSLSPKDEELYSELQRVSFALSDPSVGGPEGERLDRTNFLVAIAARLAKRAPIVREPSVLTEIEEALGLKKRGPNPYAGAEDYIRQALEIHKWAAATRERRIKRAYRVREIIHSLRGSRFRLTSPKKCDWPDKAVRWLKEERIREIAYGVACRQEGYDKLLSALTKSEQQKVKLICSNLGRVR